MPSPILHAHAHGRSVAVIHFDTDRTARLRRDEIGHLPEWHPHAVNLSRA
jgi:hypothetical protein